MPPFDPLRLYDVVSAGLAWDDALARVQEGYGHDNRCHTVNNAAVIARMTTLARGPMPEPGVA